MISQDTQQGSVTLTATSKAGSTQRYEVPCDQGVFVGASSNCGLRLSQGDVSDIHCRIGFEDGVLYLQNWISAEGTLINGELISSRAEVNVGDVITIGFYEIQVKATSQPAKSQKPDAKPATRMDRSPSQPLSKADESLAKLLARIEGDGDSPVETSVGSEPTSVSTDPTLSDTPDETNTSIDTQKHLAEQSTTALPTQPADGQPFANDRESTLDHVDPSVPQPPESMDIDADFFDFEEEEVYDRETVALLRAEIEDLQAAVAQRDAELEFQNATSEQSAVAASPESDAVLERMQELIDEANRSDERAALMEEMLHAAEQANRSDQDERNQLEAWVGDIEKRVGQREDEHAAEVEALKSRLDEASEHNQRLQKKLQQVAFNGNAPKQYEETLENLQRTNKELQENLIEAEKKALALVQKVAQLSSEQDGALREERAKIAKERAQVSRLRFELSQQLTDIEELPKNENQADRETAHRLKTLREHLREIHEQERQEEREAPLTKRLAKLWKRVEY